MRIENSEYEAMKKLNLPVMLQNYGLSLKASGPETYRTRCPFHDDKTPSLNISWKKEKWLWHCFGCSKSGNVIDFVIAYEKINFSEAYQKLAPQTIAAETPPQKTKPTPQEIESCQQETEIPRGELLNRVVEVYHQTYCEEKFAQDYLKKRGISSVENIQRFKIGYASGRLKKLLPTSGNNAIVSDLKNIGILNENNNEHFYNCIVFPIYDGNGAPRNLYGRSIVENAAVPHLYLPGPRASVWNAAAFKAHREIILTESIIDALSLWELGKQNSVALYGVNGLIEEHLRLMQEHRTEKIILCLDNDAAGNAARSVIKEKIQALGITVENLHVPEKYKDINEALVKEGKNILNQLQQENIKINLSSSENLDTNKTPAESALQIERTEEGIYFSFRGRRYRVRGLSGKTFESLRVSIRVESGGGCGESESATHLDTFDLYVAKSRSLFVSHCKKIFQAEEGEMLQELNRIIAELEKIQLTMPSQNTQTPAAIVLSAEEETEALEALKSPTLLQDILRDMEQLGYIGEEANKTIGYLVGISRKLEDPLSCVINSQSSAGKSMLSEMIEKLTAPEDVIFLSRMTTNALYYMEKTGIKRKLLIIEEREGAEAADYSIRTLQSRKKLTQAVPVKDPSSGKIKTVMLEVEGPIAYIETTTRPRIHDENATRCFELYLDESKEQTQRIHEQQRQSKTLGGLKRKALQENIERKHHNMQRLLRTIKIVNPFAQKIKFPIEWLRTRRDHLRFLNLIEGITFLNQYQREEKQLDSNIASSLSPLGNRHAATGGGQLYIESTLEDYGIAYHLAKQVMGESLTELKKPQRALLKQIEKLLDKKEDISRREIREATGLADTRLRELLSELVNLEYLQSIEGKQGKSYRYRLSERAVSAEKILEGLTSPEELSALYAADCTRSAAEGAEELEKAEGEVM